MYMSCDAGWITRKKIAIFCSLGAVIGIATYLAFVTINNPAIAATIPVILSLAACPIMCGGVTAIIVFKNLFSKNKEKKNQHVNLEEKRLSSSYSDLDDNIIRVYYKEQEEIETTKNASTRTSNDKDITIPQTRQHIQEQKTDINPN